MAAMGRLSAAIAHEIRQPLTAMAGAVKELGRMVPLEEDEKHLVGIVSRESERLNRIITDFLNYSREKSYEFAEADVAELLEKRSRFWSSIPQLQSGGKYKIERVFTATAGDAFAWIPTASSRCSGTFATTPCARCPMAARSRCRSDRLAFLGAHPLPRHRHGHRSRAAPENF